jgi:hypothetical protein
VGGADGVATGSCRRAVALAQLVLQVTGSGLGVAGVVAAEIIPFVLLAPVAGVVVCRFPRRRVMTNADLAASYLASARRLTCHRLGCWPKGCPVPTLVRSVVCGWWEVPSDSAFRAADAAGNVGDSTTRPARCCLRL